MNVEDFQIHCKIGENRIFGHLVHENVYRSVRPFFFIWRGDTYHISIVISRVEGSSFQQGGEMSPRFAENRRIIGENYFSRREIDAIAVDD